MNTTTLTTLLTMAAAFIVGMLIVFNFRSSFPSAQAQVAPGHVATASGVGIDPAQHRVATFQMW